MSVDHMRGDIFHLPQNLTVRSINSLHQDILEFLSEKTAITLQLEDSCQVDVSFVQLVEAARIYAGTAGKRVDLAEPASGSLLDVLTRGGFLDEMNAEDAQFWLHKGKVQ